ncbi:DUF998 domain-containing protein [Actinoplanes couchii]|uniref:DUF998 domain-containing protein n=1 Tax=Actinoplanes couchii TaxID=403638 RepID=A0ABQ3XGT9_9ACTN|nr:DUF998 domain-containing protein [Actinoplanes couchii]MDR6320797.1 hypothetical protein [Actinoplanes couchii]GID57718.1 hypothetical protein Aco03nite_061220 [Actinoplanes couchii]
MKALAGLGVACVIGSLALYLALHVVPPSADLDWSRRTISQYALMPNGWMFDAATLLLAAGSAAILAALFQAGVLSRAALVTLGLWVVGLLGVVWFEKHNWQAGPSISGDVHRVASVVAFLSLPIGALLAARRPAGPARGLDGPAQRLGGPARGLDGSARGLDGAARWVMIGGIVSLLCFMPILWAVASEPWTGERWWRAIPLGTVERLLGLAEVITVLLLARWALLTKGPGRKLTPAAN